MRERPARWTEEVLMTDIPRPPDRLRGQPVETCQSGNPVRRRIGGRRSRAPAGQARRRRAHDIPAAMKAGYLGTRAYEEIGVDHAILESSPRRPGFRLGFGRNDERMGGRWFSSRALLAGGAITPG